MPVGEIAAAITSLKAAFDLTKAMKDISDATKFQGTVFELQRVIIEAQESAINARDAHSAQVDRIRGLEAEVAQLKAWDAEKHRYELQNLWKGFYAYIPKAGEERGEPPHAICTNCYQRGIKSILQCNHSGRNIHEQTWDCPNCKTRILCQWSDIGELIKKIRAPS